jgi:hypothetical protein
VKIGKQQILGWAGLGLIIGMVVCLGSWARIQTIGRPGVRVGERPLHMKAAGSKEPAVIVATNSVLLPETVLNYRSEELPLDPSVWGTLPKDTVYGQRTYEAPDRFGIQQTVVLMGTDRTSIHKPEFCLEGGGWHIFSAESVRIPMERPVAYELPVRRMLIRTERRHPATGEMVPLEGVYLFWFVSEDKMTSEHGERMWWMARDLITRGELQRWAYVIAFSVCAPGDTEPTYERMVRFLKASVPEFQTVPASPGEVALVR